MNRKQKDELRFLLKARKRADKVLAKRREAEQKKLDYKMAKETNQELMERYSRELTALAQESGILAMAEQAAQDRNGNLVQQVSYYIYYGLSTNNLQRNVEISGRGELRAAYLALHIIWGQPDEMKEAEIRVHKNGQITFHTFVLPVFPFFWRRYPQLVRNMLTKALENPRPPSVPVKTNG